MRIKFLIIFLISSALAFDYRSGFKGTFPEFNSLSRIHYSPNNNVCEEILGHNGLADKLLMKHCERLFPKNIFSAFSPKHGVSMEYLTISSENLTQQIHNLNGHESTKTLSSIVDWQLVYDFNFEAIALWDEIKMFYALNDNQTRSKFFELLIKRSLNESEKEYKEKVLNFKSRVNSFLETATIPVYMNLPHKIEFHPLFNQILVEKLVKEFPSRSLGDSRRSIRNFSNYSFYFDAYMLQSVEGMPLDIVEGVKNHVKSFVDFKSFSEVTKLSFPEWKDQFVPGWSQISNWGVTRVIVNAYYLIAIQEKKDCKNLGLWPTLARTFFANFNSLNVSFFFDNMLGDYNLHNYLKNQIKSFCGKVHSHTIYSPYYTPFAASMYLYRLMGDGEKITKGENQYAWWN